MPVFELEESNYTGPIPEDEVLKASIVGIKVVTKPFKDDDGEDVKRVEFAFVVNDPGSQWDGQKLWGDTPTRFNDHPDCRLRAWAQEALGGSELPKGFKLDTDQLVGSQVRVVVAQKTYTKDGQEKVRNYVKDLLRGSGGGATSTFAALDDDEPF